MDDYITAHQVSVGTQIEPIQRIKIMSADEWETLINPYEPDEAKDNGVIAQNLANDFYEYLANKITHEQVILIENTEVPKYIIDKRNYVQYTKNKGFIPA